MGGMFKTPKVKTDTSALRAAEEQRKKAKEAAQAAEAKQAAIDAANQQRKANVSASGRASTTLAGETGSGGSLLGG